MEKWRRYLDGDEPEEGQEVVYWFKYVGMHTGVFNISDEPEVGFKMGCFSSKSGFLCDENVYWIPKPESEDDIPPITVDMANGK